MKLRVNHLYYNPVNEQYFSAHIVPTISWDSTEILGDSIELIWETDSPFMCGGRSSQVESYSYLVDLGYNDLDRKPSVNELLIEINKLEEIIKELEKPDNYGKIETRHTLNVDEDDFEGAFGI